MWIQRMSYKEASETSLIASGIFARKPARKPKAKNRMKNKQQSSLQLLKPSTVLRQGNLVQSTVEQSITAVNADRNAEPASFNGMSSAQPRPTFQSRKDR